MTVSPQIVSARPSQSSNDDWVLSLSLDEPGRVLPDSTGWVEHGPFSAFFHGLLYDREVFPSPIDKPESSDTQLLLRAYEREGEAFLSRLRGSFVFAILDRARNVAIITRDPLGSHPLFYVENGSHVLFSGSALSLVKQPGVSREFNRAALADHLCYRWPDTQETFFASVRRVPPTWRAIIRNRRIHLDRYWDPMPLGPAPGWLMTKETVRFDEVLHRAIDRCLKNGPTGVYLSGGLDSISVAGVAADLARQNGQNSPLALSLGFPDPECDERDRQVDVARGLGLRQHFMDFDEAIGSRPLGEQWAELNQYLSAPISNVWQPAYLALAARAKLDGVRTILSGHGGDEWLTVSPYLSADLIRCAAFIQLAELFGTFWRSYKSSALTLTRNVAWKFGLRPVIGAMLNRAMPRVNKAMRLKRMFDGDPVWVAPDKNLRSQQRRRAECTLAPSEPPEGFYLREVRRGIDHPLTSWELEEHHALGKRIGISFQHPFWDPDVVELLFRTPPLSLCEGGRSKGLVRGTLARRFPNLELERQRKIAATSFFRSLLARELPALAGAAGKFPVLSGLGIVDGQAMRGVVRDGLAQGGKKLQGVWTVINLELWTRSHAIC